MAKYERSREFPTNPRSNNPESVGVSALVNVHVTAYPGSTFRVLTRAPPQSNVRYVRTYSLCRWTLGLNQHRFNTRMKKGRSWQESSMHEKQPHTFWQWTRRGRMSGRDTRLQDRAERGKVPFSFFTRSALLALKTGTNSYAGWTYLRIQCINALSSPT